MEYKWKLIRVTRATYRFCLDDNQKTSIFRIKKDGLILIEDLYNSELISAENAIELINELFRLTIPTLYHNNKAIDPLAEELDFLDYVEEVRDSFESVIVYESLPDLPCILDNHPYPRCATLFYLKNEETLERNNQSFDIFSISFTNKTTAFEWLESNWHEFEEFNDVLVINRLRLDIEKLSIPLYPIVKRLKLKKELSEFIKSISMKN